MANPFVKLLDSASNAFLDEMRAIYSHVDKTYETKAAAEASEKKLEKRLGNLDETNRRLGKDFAQQVTRQNALADRVSALEAENQKLREDVNKLIDETRWIPRSAA